MLPNPQLSGFSAYRLQTSALAVILYTFVTQTHPPINRLSIVMALGWWSLTQTRKSFNARNGRWWDCFLGLFLQRRGETAYPVLTKVFLKQSPDTAMLVCTLQVYLTNSPSPYAWRTLQEVTSHAVADSFISEVLLPMHVIQFYSSCSNQYAVYRVRGHSLNLPPVQND